MVELEFRRHGAGQRISAVSSATVDQQIHSALVRRQSGGLDHVHAFFSGDAVCRLCLCPLVAAHLLAPRPGHLPRHLAHRRAVPAACDTRCKLEAARQFAAHLADLAAIGNVRGAALLCPFGHRAAAAGLVQPRLSGPLALPAVCPVQYRLAIGPAQLSVRVRAVVRRAGTDTHVVDRLLGVCRSVRALPHCGWCDTIMPRLPPRPGTSIPRRKPLPACCAGRYGSACRPAHR